MTLDTQLLARIILQIVLETRAMRIMTTDTGDRLACSRIPDLVADRMGKGPLALMTSGTGIIAAFLQHGELVRSMHGVAVAADNIVRMSELGIGHHLQGPWMAGPTDLTLVALKQAGIIAGMGSMTVGAGVAGTACQVAVSVKHLLNDLCMAAETDPGRHLAAFCLVAVIAASGKRLVQHITNHTFFSAAVRIMTGKTILCLFGEPFMGPADIRARVTGDTDIAFLADLKEQWIFSIMGLVTIAALPLGKGRMGYLVTAGQILVACETDGHPLALHQSV